MSRFFVCTLIVLMSNAVALSAQIRGEYLEARSCDVYNGPCFANAEWGLAGKEAVLAWKVESGQWNDVDLGGLGVALILQSERTLANDGVFPMKPGRVQSVLIVDVKGDSAQREALAAFVRKQAGGLADQVVKTMVAPIELSNNHITGHGRFSAGDMASIQTRGLKKGDCVCTNEEMCYQPLVKVKDISPAYTKSVQYRGDGIRNQYNLQGLRSAFLATFRI